MIGDETFPFSGAYVPSPPLLVFVRAFTFFCCCWVRNTKNKGATHDFLPNILVALRDFRVFETKLLLFAFAVSVSCPGCLYHFFRIGRTTSTSPSSARSTGTAATAGRGDSSSRTTGRIRWMICLFVVFKRVVLSSVVRDLFRSRLCCVVSGPSPSQP